ncbi:ranBP-type and C3HC4-type zinc finger-containing protein 1 [Folsomia candida]|uniref:ranBP-type and C3HC4-type zinc finger-containing protein 1 n=1 Tax=Folsomia candida TaxID=158441 RepID=UPI0016055D57|nr:ranBP-type and C3HC4-type zinc finger-containing protein 1 [Folsomia candida]
MGSCQKSSSSHHSQLVFDAASLNYDEASTSTSSPGIMSTFEDTICAFCGIPLKPGAGVVLDKCLHNFCRDCLLGAIEVTDDVATTGCPVAEETGCDGSLLDREVKAMLSPEAYEKYLTRSLNIAVQQMNDFVQCFNTRCNALFALHDRNNTFEFKCGKCFRLNCLKCKTLRDDVGQCECINPPDRKIAKIDPELKRDWDEKWNHAQSSIIFSGANGGELIQNTREFQCNICFCDIGSGEGVILKECFHLFCKDCLNGTIMHCEDLRVKCPYTVNEFMCNSFLTSGEIKALLGQEEHEKFLKRSVVQAEMAMSNSFHCKSVNCPGWCEIDNEVGIADLEHFFCPVCKRKNCLKCKAIHEAVSCTEYQQQLQEDEMDTKTKQMIKAKITSGQAMKCPTCKVIIEKVSGCDAVICQMCKTHICWATKGPRWGPRGIGDKSGGCHCREKGKVCHPKCRNCH